MKHIPQCEIEAMLESIHAHPEYFEPERMIHAYRSKGLQVVPDPFSADIVVPIQQALLAEKGLSVIRIGDGEMNLLSYGAYAHTPHLDDRVVQAILSKQQDTFTADPGWMVILRDLMLGAVAQADLIGVIGLWRPPGPASTEHFAQRFLQDHRGISGHWRAMDYMLKLASQGLLNQKILTSAHLYFAVLEHLRELLPLARQVFMISDRENVLKKMAISYPHVHFKYIPVGQHRRISEKPHDKPDFLLHLFSALPKEMPGVLCLVGAGPWAEIYCTWIKQRGGVGVDFGTGFDLLDGQMTRPIHKILGLERIGQYAL